MRGALTIATLVSFVSALSGCTTLSDYWHKPTKKMNMPVNDEHRMPYPPVSTLSLDASRRLVISEQVNDSPHVSRFTCPEPPPDVAMNSLSESLFAARTRTGNSVDAASMAAFIAQVLSGRSSTVEVWRTTSSMYCVLLMNGKDKAAQSYLDAAQVVAKMTKDTMPKLPAPGAFPTLEFAKQARQEAIEKQATAASAQADATSATVAANTAEQQATTELTAAKAACDAVPEDKKAENADCKKVATAAESGVPQTSP